MLALSLDDECKIEINMTTLAAPIAKSLASKMKLNDGVEIPMFGLGTYRLDGPLIASAIEKGYRMLDSAENYNLATDYIDLYLLHAPQGGKCGEVYRALQEHKKSGKIRSLGVSNFGIHHLKALEKLGLDLPSVNQIEMHPWQLKTDIVNYCQSKNIVIIGYSPLAKGKKVDDETIIQIAQKLQKTPAQILIRWSVQRGLITIPRTSSEKRLMENADVFNWSIPENEMEILNALGKSPWSCTWDPTKNDLETAFGFSNQELESRSSLD
ncbi:unnamed protein product [Didymodactylos carnosus]|uniref:NADP-dependent oxidoreductase domain-containing protein n=1 Tax=Didymodactylos carnosus TaxID=1234261 RepID=A0A814XVN7_9BILA|nr:unnamed protein product [Didymodactylos carnosus]CAF3984366.1 unnamed protein product [Didymodactylos carnosus]